MPIDDFGTDTLTAIRAKGYTDDQIWDRLAAADPRFAQARQMPDGNLDKIAGKYDGKRWDSSAVGQVSNYLTGIPGRFAEGLPKAAQATLELPNRAATGLSTMLPGSRVADLQSQVAQIQAQGGGAQPAVGDMGISTEAPMQDYAAVPPEQINPELRASAVAQLQGQLPAAQEAERTKFLGVPASALRDTAMTGLLASGGIGAAAVGGAMAAPAAMDALEVQKPFDAAASKIASSMEGDRPGPVREFLGETTKGVIQELPTIAMLGAGLAGEHAAAQERAAAAYGPQPPEIPAGAMPAAPPKSPTSDMLNQVEAAQANSLLEPKSLDDLSNKTVQEQLAHDVGLSAVEYQRKLKPEWWDELRQIRDNDPDKLPDAIGLAQAKIDNDLMQPESLAEQQKAKAIPEAKLDLGAVDQNLAMKDTVLDPVKNELLAKDVLDLPEAKPLTGWSPPAETPVPEGAGALKTAAVGALNNVKDAAYLAKMVYRVPMHLFAKYFADPMKVLPRLSYEAGRAYERMAHTRQLFLDHTKEAIKDLGPDERLATAAMLDMKPADWLKSKALRQMLDTESGDKVHAAYMSLRSMLDKLADVEGLEKHERVTDYFPHILEDDWQRKNPNGLSVPELGVYAPATVNRFHMPREGGNQYSLDLVDVLNARISLGLRKAYMNPVVSAFEPRFLGLSKPLQDYADLYVRRLQGRPGPIHEQLDNFMRSVTNNALNIGDLTRSQVWFTMQYYRGLLGFALDTAFKNLTQVQNTIADVGFKKTRQGMAAMLTDQGRRVFNKSGIGTDYERIVESSGNFKNAFWNVADKALFAPMRTSEYINRSVAFHGGLLEAYDKGLTGSQAVNYAKDVVDRTQFRYGVTNTSPYLQNPLGKLAYQFSSYPIKEIHFMADVLKSKDKTTRMLLLHGFALAGAKLTGTTINQAMGQEDWTIPLPHGRSVKIPLPTDLITHFLRYSAPTPKLALNMAAWALEKQRGVKDGPAWRALKESALNTIPARRYLYKLYQVYEKTQHGNHGLPYTGVQAAENVTGIGGK